MKDQKTVLLIEDIGGSRKTYKEIISSVGYSVDDVANLDEAFAKIQRRTYHVAVVDITLDVDDVYNRYGLTILEYLHTLKEGTESIILSGQPELEVAIAAYEKFRLVQYIEKRKLKKPADLITAVNKAYEKCRIKELGDWGSLEAFLSGKEDPSFWAYQCLEILQPSQGMSGLNDFLSEFCKPYTPMLPSQDVASPMVVNKEDKSLSGHFWSKALGKGISLIAYPRKYGEEILKKEHSGKLDVRNLIRKYERANILGLVFTSSLKRDVFVDRL